MGIEKIKIEKENLSIGITDFISIINPSMGIEANEILKNNFSRFTENFENELNSHKEYFKKYPISDARYEVPVKVKFRYKDIILTFFGRVDAYDEANGNVYELKIYELTEEQLYNKELIELFSFQLMMYGLSLSKEKRKVENLILIVVNSDKSKKLTFNYDFDREEVQKKIRKVFPFLYDIYLFEKERKKFNNRKANFPYENIKEIQTEIISQIQGSEKKITFIEAPFASGKTVATLYALVRKFNFPKIHYFTSKNVQKLQVADEAAKIGFCCIIRNSIEEKCYYKYSICRMKKCKFYRTPIEKYSIFREEDCKLIWEKTFTPAFDIVIADYNLMFYNSLPIDKNTICVIDEYHSFLSRLSDFFSITFLKDDIIKTEKLINEKYPALKADFYSLLFTDDFKVIYDETDFDIDQYFYKNNSLKSNFDNEFLDAVSCFSSKFLAYYNGLPENKASNLVKDLYPFFHKLQLLLDLSQFDIISSYFPLENKKIFTYRDEKSLLNILFRNYNNIIGISATLEPKELIFSLHDTDSFSIYTTSEPRKIRAYIIKSYETVSKKRKENIYGIAHFIKERIKLENINNRSVDCAILLFFPSYRFIVETEMLINDSLFDKILYMKDEQIGENNGRLAAYSSLNENIEKSKSINADIENYKYINNCKTYSGNATEIEKIFSNGKIHLLFVPYRSKIAEGANFGFNVIGGFCVGLPFRVPDSLYKTRSAMMDDIYDPFALLSLFPAINDVLQSSGRVARNLESDSFLYFIGKEFTENGIMDKIRDYYENLSILD